MSFTPYYEVHYYWDDGFTEEGKTDGNPYNLDHDLDEFSDDHFDSFEKAEDWIIKYLRKELKTIGICIDIQEQISEEHGDIHHYKYYEDYFWCYKYNKKARMEAIYHYYAELLDDGGYIEQGFDSIEEGRKNFTLEWNDGEYTIEELKMGDTLPLKMQIAILQIEKGEKFKSHDHVINYFEKNFGDCY